MITVVYILLALVVVGFVFQPLFNNTKGEVNRASRSQERLRELLEERERIYGAIRELDFDYRMGKVEEDDYQQTRTRYQEQAIVVLKAIDQSNGRPEAIESRVEREIASLRHPRKGAKKAAAACSHCGAPIPPKARFCSQCGNPLSPQ